MTPCDEGVWQVISGISTIASMEKLCMSPFTSTLKLLNTESSSVLQLYTPEDEDVADWITSVLLLPSDWMFTPNFGQSFTPSLYQQIWLAGSEISHCNMIGLPASTDLLPSASGTAENQSSAIAISLH